MDDPRVQLFEAMYNAAEDLTAALIWTYSIPTEGSDTEALRQHRQSCQDTIDALAKAAVLFGRGVVNSDYYEGFLDLVGKAERYAIPK